MDHKGRILIFTGDGNRDRIRAEGGGQDMFSQFATAEYEDGSQMPVDEVVDHMNFLMMAAHDTTTSTLTTMFYVLAKNPEWQERLRKISQDLQKVDLEFEDLAKLEEMEWCMKECLRMFPPLPTMPFKRD